MRIATWNVNSIRTRVDRVVDWMVREDVDVLAMQEIKCTAEQFPIEQFEEAGYQLAIHGLNQWNGVAIASRSPLQTVETSFPGMPGFLKGVEGPDQPQEARAIGATVDGVHVWSLYVPNGRSLDDPHYTYKLDWLAALADYTRAQTTARPEVPFALMGDFNIAPFDEDNGDPVVVEGLSTHVSPPIRYMAWKSPGHDVGFRSLWPLMVRRLRSRSVRWTRGIAAVCALWSSQLNARACARVGRSWITGSGGPCKVPGMLTPMRLSFFLSTWAPL